MNISEEKIAEGQALWSLFQEDMKARRSATASHTRWSRWACELAETLVDHSEDFS